MISKAAFTGESEISSFFIIDFLILSIMNLRGSKFSINFGEKNLQD